MTVKQIAEAVGKDTRSVQRWVKDVSDKMSSISDKMSSSSPAHPADYTIEETCMIIETGLGKAAADVYRTNAANAELQKRPAKMSGALLAEINKAFDRSILSKNEARAMLGLPPAAEPILIAGNIGRISKQAYAVEMKVREKEQAKIEARGMKSLFDEA